jgi:hypothetical protein
MGGFSRHRRARKVKSAAHNFTTATRASAISSTQTTLSEDNVLSMPRSKMRSKDRHEVVL